MKLLQVSDICTVQSRHPWGLLPFHFSASHYLWQKIIDFWTREDCCIFSIVLSSLLILNLCILSTSINVFWVCAPTMTLCFSSALFKGWYMLNYSQIQDECPYQIRTDAAQVEYSWFSSHWKSSTLCYHPGKGDKLRTVSTIELFCGVHYWISALLTWTRPVTWNLPTPPLFWGEKLAFDRDSDTGAWDSGPGISDSNPKSCRNRCSQKVWIFLFSFVLM